MIHLILALSQASPLHEALRHRHVQQPAQCLATDHSAVTTTSNTAPPAIQSHRHLHVRQANDHARQDTLHTHLLHCERLPSMHALRHTAVAPLADGNHDSLLQDLLRQLDAIVELSHLRLTRFLLTLQCHLSHCIIPVIECPHHSTVEPLGRHRTHTHHLAPIGPPSRDGTGYSEASEPLHNPVASVLQILLAA